MTTQGDEGLLLHDLPKDRPRLVLARLVAVSLLRRAWSGFLDERKWVYDAPSHTLRIGARLIRVPPWWRAGGHPMRDLYFEGRIKGDRDLQLGEIVPDNPTPEHILGHLRRVLTAYHPRVFFDFDEFRLFFCGDECGLLHYKLSSGYNYHLFTYPEDGLPDLYGCMEVARKFWRRLIQASDDQWKWSPYIDALVAIRDSCADEFFRAWQESMEEDLSPRDFNDCMMIASACDEGMVEWLLKGIGAREREQPGHWGGGKLPRTVWSIIAAQRAASSWSKPELACFVPFSAIAGSGDSPEAVAEWLQRQGLSSTGLQLLRFLPLPVLRMLVGEWARYGLDDLSTCLPWLDRLLSLLYGTRKCPTEMKSLVAAARIAAMAAVAETRWKVVFRRTTDRSEKSWSPGCNDGDFGSEGALAQSASRLVWQCESDKFVQPPAHRDFLQLLMSQVLVADLAERQAMLSLLTRLSEYLNHREVHWVRRDIYDAMSCSTWLAISHKLEQLLEHDAPVWDEVIRDHRRRRRGERLDVPSDHD